MEALVISALSAVNLQLVDLEVSNHGKIVRVFIEKEGHSTAPLGGVSVTDCEMASRHLQRVFEVEGIEYDRLEVSSPGLDRKLRTVGDFSRFVGYEVDVLLRTLVGGRRHVVGRIVQVIDERVALDGASGSFIFDLSNLKRARLVPRI